MSYDNLDRMVSANYADGSVHSYVYDAEGNRTQSQIVDADGTRTWRYAYDNRNRLSQETKPNGATLQYSYDGQSNKTQLITTQANGASDTISYTYDALNRLATVTNTDGTSTYGYDEVGNRTSLSYPNGSSQTWRYDTRNRLTSTKIYNATGAIIQSFDYTLHPTGRRTKITELDGRTSDYTYNDRYWLTTETITDAINGNYSASYTYDNVGNRVQGIEAGVTTQYQYDANDRISQQGGVTYTYDANGNTLEENDQGSLTRYRWNSRNELVEHEAGGFITDYQYNAEGIRHSQSDGITDRTYLVDANRSYAQVLAESANGSQAVAYHYGDDLISQTRDNQTHHFHVDGLGSTRVLTDSSGNQTDRYGYAAFGEVLAQDGNTDNDYLYTGEQFDEGLDQYYLRARYYDQGRGRFTRMDDWDGRETEPTTLNKYLYANLDPILMVDPTGYFSLGSVGASQNIQSTLATRAGVSGLRSAVNRAVGATLKQSASPKQALKLLRQCIKKKDKCNLEINLLIVGSDNDEMRRHIQHAQIAQYFRTVVLTYIKSGKSRSGWYKSKQECKTKPTGTDCDEYPMRSTKEGGSTRYKAGMVSLRGVSPSQNRSVGGHFGFLASRMKHEEKFVVITSNTLPTVALPIK